MFSAKNFYQKFSDPHHSSIVAWADVNAGQTSRFCVVIRSLVRLVLIFTREFQRNELSLRSGALTYTIMLSLVPILAMSTAVLKGLGGDDQLRKAAYSYIESLEEESTGQQTVPQGEGGADLVRHLRSAADQLFDYVDRTNFATLGSIGVIGILLSALLVFSHIESAMNAIWKVSAGRSMLRKLADYLTLLILVPISINVAFAASAFLKNPLLSSKMDALIPVPWLQSLLLKPLPIFFIAITFCVMYVFFPNTRVRTLPAVLGATLAAVLLFTVQNVYINLQVGVAKYNAIYGSFATLPLFLIWIFLGWMFILTGAQVTFALQNLASYRLTRASTPPSYKLGAAFDIMDQIYLAFDQQRRITVRHLTAELPLYIPQVLEDVTLELSQAGLIHISTAEEILLPAAPKERYDKQRIIKTVLGEEVAETAGGQQSRQVIEDAGHELHQTKT